MRRRRIEIESGFDMVPRLSKDSVDDKEKWQAFINAVKDHYKDDDAVEVKSKFIEFKVGEHPLLPLEGHKFLRFSADYLGPFNTSSNTLSYKITVMTIAIAIFGSRIHRWSDLAKDLGNHDPFYDWSDVHESIRSYFE